LPSISRDRFVEPVKVWRGLAQSAFVAMRFAAALRRSRDAGSEPDNRRTLIKIASRWLANGSVGVYLADCAPEQRWPAGVEFRLSPGVGLYGVLVAQLALAVTLSRLLYVCAECGKLFTPKRGVYHVPAGVPFATSAKLRGRGRNMVCETCERSSSSYLRRKNRRGLEPLASNEPRKARPPLHNHVPWNPVSGLSCCHAMQKGRSRSTVATVCGTGGCAVIAFPERAIVAESHACGIWPHLRGQ
jgi:hypothetical protein